MRPLADFPAAAADDISYVLTDIDGTLTREGRLPAATYGALERLQEAGLKVIPVTAGSSGWCDLIARMWPVDAVISENGGIYFYRVPTGAIERRYWANAAEGGSIRNGYARSSVRPCALFPGSRHHQIRIIAKRLSL